MTTGRSKKVTVVLPEDLILRAERSSGEGLTATIRRGLELVAAKDAYEGVRKLRGKLRLSIDLGKLRTDRAP